MYWDLQELDSKNIFEADICVVGAGAAGIPFVNEFLGSAVRVFLLESGGLTFEKETQELAAGHNVGLPYYPLDLTRFREFGGSTTLRLCASWVAYRSAYDDLGTDRSGFPRCSGTRLTLMDRSARSLVSLRKYVQLQQ